MVDGIALVERRCVEFGWCRAISSLLLPSLWLYRSLYMMTHLHPPTSSSPLDLVREGFNLFVLGSDHQLGPSPLPRLLLSIASGSASTCSQPNLRIMRLQRRPKEERGVKKGRRKNVPSSALIENDRTEIWMTVGFVDTVEVGRLFAVRQHISRSNLQLSDPSSSHSRTVWPGAGRESSGVIQKNEASSRIGGIRWWKR